MNLVVLYGRPAVGKLTVARELAQLSEWRLFHNHLIVDALLAVFEFGSKPFVELREKIWTEVFAESSAAGVNGVIFTFSPENTVRQAFVDRLASDARARGDVVHFIHLTCSEIEIERRLRAASRLASRKLTSLELHRQLTQDGVFDRPIMPAPDFSIDTGATSPAEAGQQIWTKLRG